MGGLNLNEYNKIYHGDCLSESDKIESGSVDLILTDLPYGTLKGATLTSSKTRNDEYYWDVTIDINKIYEIANRILRPNGKMILFSQEPYTTKLINNSIRNIPFSYRAIWEKDNFANALITKGAMVGYFEDILLFSKRYDADMECIHPLRPYFRDILAFIRLNLKQINTKLGHRRAEHTFYINSTQYELCTEETYNELIQVFKINEMQGFRVFSDIKEVNNKFKTNFPSTFNLWQGNKYKSNILKYKKDYEGLHPCQKPILLLEDLVQTFSNKNNLVVDLTVGSGSTLVACLNTNRRYIGIEKDELYYNIAIDRVRGYINHIIN